MSMTRPIPNTVPAFDATSPYQFTFNVLGGNQVVSNRLKIRDNATGTIVYNELQISFQFVHNLPANTLINGKYYSFSITTYDAQNNESPESMQLPFYCYTTPTLTFINIPSDNLINNSGYTFQFTYDQKEKEMLGNYTVYLYDTQGSVIATSGEKFNTSQDVPLYLDYPFTGFTNNTGYQIEVVGYTVNDTKITTGKISFVVRYIEPATFSLIELTNNCLGGYITVKSNIVVIDGESNPDPPNYLKCGEVDITNPEHWVKWNTGLKISGNFTGWIYARNFNVNQKQFLMVSDLGENLTLTYRYVPTKDLKNIKAYFELGVGDYMIKSNYIDVPTEKEIISLWIRRKGSIYDLIIKNEGELTC